MKIKYLFVVLGNLHGNQKQLSEGERKKDEKQKVGERGWEM